MRGLKQHSSAPGRRRKTHTDVMGTCKQGCTAAFPLACLAGNCAGCLPRPYWPAGDAPLLRICSRGSVRIWSRFWVRCALFVWAPSRAGMRFPSRFWARVSLRCAESGEDIPALPIPMPPPMPAWPPLAWTVPLARPAASRMTESIFVDFMVRSLKKVGGINAPVVRRRRQERYRARRLDPCRPFPGGEVRRLRHKAGGPEPADCPGWVLARADYAAPPRRPDLCREDAGDHAATTG